jgi:hypothetical protein
MGCEAPGAPQTSEIDHFRPTQNSCIKNPGVGWLPGGPPIAVRGPPKLKGEERWLACSGSPGSKPAREAKRNDVDHENYEIVFRVFFFIFFFLDRV